MKKFKLTLTVLSALLILVLVESCKKDDEPSTGNMDIYMTDAPGDYKEVNVDVKAVEIHYDDGNGSGWIALPTKAGIYDLLTLRDSVTALIANGTSLRAGRVDQMRLILGENNTVVVDSMGTFPLETPSAQNTGLKININSTIPIDETLVITIDFDAEKSIVETGNGKYQLKPVIKVKEVRVQ